MRWREVLSDLNRYPNASGLDLRERLAQRHGVGVGQVHLGNGSVSLLAQLISAAAGAGDEVVYAWRSFEAYPGLVTVAGATSVRVPNRPDGGHDLDAMAGAITDRTRVVIVCTPNNPTGTIVTAAEFESFMAAVPKDLLVLLDEAYYEFVTDDDSRRRHAAARPVPQPGRAPHLLEGVRARRAAHRLRRRTGGGARTRRVPRRSRCRSRTPPVWPPSPRSTRRTS